jgi:hypothetical protein
LEAVEHVVKGLQGTDLVAEMRDEAEEDYASVVWERLEELDRAGIR